MYNKSQNITFGATRRKMHNGNGHAIVLLIIDIHLDGCVQLPVLLLKI